MDTPPDNPTPPQAAEASPMEGRSGHAMLATALMMGAAGASGSPSELGFVGFMIVFAILFGLGRLFAWLFGYVSSIAGVVAVILFFVLLFNTDSFDRPGFPTFFFMFLMIATTIKVIQLVMRAVGRSRVASE